MSGNFLKDNIVSLIGLAITCGGLLIHIGVTKAELTQHRISIDKFENHGSPVSQRALAEIAVLRSSLVEYKFEVKEKVKEMEQIQRETQKEVTQKLDELNRQVTVVVTWIEEQKRNRTNN